jgi:hypothetical protein
MRQRRADLFFVNSKQRPAAVLLDRCEYAIGGQRDIRERVRIV